MMQCAARLWRDGGRGGSIVNIVVSPRGLHHVAHSCAARAGVIAFSDAVSVEWAPLGIRVNCVAPGSIEFKDGVWDRRKRDEPDLYNATLANCPMGRMGTPEEVAEVVVFLASPRASYITASSLRVDGGIVKGIDW